MMRSGLWSLSLVLGASLTMGGAIAPRFSAILSTSESVLANPDLPRSTLGSAGVEQPSLVEFRQTTAQVGDRQVSLAILDINPRQTGVILRPFWASPYQLTGLIDTGTAANQHGAIAAINGGYFNRYTQQPLGAIRREGRWISSPILGRGVVAWDDAGDFVFDRVEFEETLTVSRAGQAIELSVIDLNSAYLRAGFARYTTDWGYRYTTQTDGEVAIVVDDGAISKIYPAAPASEHEVSIPANGYLLVARQAEAVARAAQLQVGDRLVAATSLSPTEIEHYPHAIGGGPLLLKNGEIVLDADLEQFQPSFAVQQAARSAIGRTADGNLVWVTAGRGYEEAGLTLAEMSLLMQQLGCEDALNLDGGNSSTLYVNGEIVNRNGYAARVHNFLGIFPGLPAQASR